MKICIVTGSAGLIGSEAVRYFSSKFDKVLGIDNDIRQELFGVDGSTRYNKESLIKNIKNYEHYSFDIRDQVKIDRLFETHKSDIKLIIHTAAQPSHDLAAKDPVLDFTINANGTLNLLEATRENCPEAVFIYTSTNKVYGDWPNTLPFKELETRYDLPTGHKLWHGLDETTPIDQCMHSLFGVSKLSADLMVQEYGRYFGMNTGIFRGGCLTGPNHAGAEQHGFLNYLMKCVISGREYTVNGYKAKQVRDNIHAYDLVRMFDFYYQNPKQGEVYNAGGGRHSNCSLLEAWTLSQVISNRQAHYIYKDEPRKGDHQWYITNEMKFRSHYPEWNYTYDLRDILTETYECLIKK